MEKFLYSAAARRGARTPLSGADLLRVLESRRQSYQALSDSLAECRAAFIANNIDGIMTGVEVQSALCEDIRRYQDSIQAFCRQHAPAQSNLADVLSEAELMQAQDIMRQSMVVIARVSQQNKVYADMVRKAAHHNALLRNLYQNGIVYSDPRLNESSGGLCGTSEARYG
jgi:hypothetical protein